MEEHECFMCDRKYKTWKEALNCCKEKKDKLNELKYGRNN